MEFILIGIAVFLNIVLIKWKFDRRRYADMLLDLTLMLGIIFLFSSSYSALVVGTVASLLISLYLLVSPPRISL